MAGFSQIQGQGVRGELVHFDGALVVSLDHMDNPGKLQEFNNFLDQGHEVEFLLMQGLQVEGREVPLARKFVPEELLLEPEQLNLFSLDIVKVVFSKAEPLENELANVKNCESAALELVPAEMNKSGFSGDPDEEVLLLRCEPVEVERHSYTEPFSIL